MIRSLYILRSSRLSRLRNLRRCYDLLRKRKTSDPIGWQQSGSQMRAANIPMELDVNVAKRRHIQQRKRTLTPRQKKGRRVQLPEDWESY